MPAFTRLFVAWLIIASHPWLFAAENVPAEPLRRPLAIHALRDGKQVLTANRCGTLSLVDLSLARPVQEFAVGKQLSDLNVLPATNPADPAERFLLTDEASHQLIEVQFSGEKFAITDRYNVAPYPVTVRSSATGSWVSVASLWSRQVTLFTRPPAGGKLQQQKVVDIPFAPRSQIFLPGDEQLVVFDAFGGRLVLINVAQGEINFERRFPGHSVRGLTLDRDGTMLLAAHQMLNPFAHVGKSDMHWGLLMSNDLRWMSIASLLTKERELYAGGQVHPLGIPDHGGGDPAGLAMNSAGTVVVCLGGVNEVMIGKREDDSLRVIPVGQRPTAVTFSHDQKTAFVANTFEDSISLVDIASEKQSGVIRLANERPRSLLERGEELFYDARFSHEGWMSCHSCHVDGHSNFTRNDNLSDGGFGAPKLVLSLLGRKHTAPFAWNASVDTLTEQVRNSLEKTMQTDHAHIPEADVQALAAYIESLPAPPNVDKLRGKLDQAAVQRGQAIFTQRECAQCHAPPHFTVARVEDVRLPDEMGKRLFNPPTLRGISQRDAFFHDGRALSLKDVFWKHNHPADHVWRDEEVRDLVAYLRSL